MKHTIYGKLLWLPYVLIAFAALSGCLTENHVFDMANYVLTTFCVCLHLSFVLSAIVPVSNSSASLDPVLSESCQILGQRFPNQLHWPGTEQYTNENSRMQQIGDLHRSSMQANM